MTAATRRRPTELGTPSGQPLPSYMGWGLAAGVAVKKGWALARNAAGYLVAFTSALNLRSAGVAFSDADNTNGSNGDHAVNVYTQPVILENGASADAFVDADAPAVAWGGDNQTACKTSATGTRSIMGVFLGLDENSLPIVWMGPVAHVVAQAMNLSAGLSSTSAGFGASLISIQDAASNFVATNVEAALAEIMTLVVSLASVQQATGTLVAGDVTISSLNITASSKVIPVRDNPDATAAHWGALTITGVTPGTPGSFHIHSANVADTSGVRGIVIG